MNIPLASLPFILVILSAVVPVDLYPFPAEEKPALVLEGAKYIQQKIENGETVIILEGDVRWSRGESRLRCDRAKYFEESNLLYLSRDVRLVEGNRRVRADSIRYVSEREFAVAIGNVVLEIADGDVVVRTDSLDYDLDARESWAFRRPELLLSEEDDEKRDSGEVRIVGDHLHMLEENYLAIAGSVDISGDSLLGASDSLNYNLVSDRIVLRGSPWIEIGSYRLGGETLELHVPGRVLKRGRSMGSARGEQRKMAGAPGDREGRRTGESDAGEDITNWIEADSIYLSFRENRIDTLLAFPNARSYYRMEQQGGAEENYVTGDEILLKWEDRQLEIIRVRGRGEGVYRRDEEIERSEE